MADNHCPGDCKVPSELLKEILREEGDDCVLGRGRGVVRKRGLRLLGVKLQPFKDLLSGQEYVSMNECVFQACLKIWLFKNREGKNYHLIWFLFCNFNWTLCDESTVGTL